MGKNFQSKKVEQESQNTVATYFSNPGAPGHRGLNENLNSIVRQDLSVHSQRQLNEIAMKYNRTLRRSLNYDTPEEVMKKQLD